MKGIKYISMAALLVSLSACSHDWLDVEPSTSIQTSESIKVLNDVEFTLNGTYSLMQSAGAYSGKLMYYGDVTGDDMQAVSSTKRTGNYYRFNWTKDYTSTSEWANLYSIITNCNLVLNGLDAVEVMGEDEEAKRNDLKGQALAIRGLAYFDLTRIFGYPYKKDNGASLGVPLVLEPLQHEAKPARATVAECYKQFIGDLKEASELIDPEFKRGKMTRWAAMTLLARAYLYKGDDAAALATAKAAIKGAEGEKYELWATDDYPTAWATEASDRAPGEVLFEIVNETTDSPGKESMGYLNSSSGYDDMCVTTSFYNLIREDPDDIRIKLMKSDKKRYEYVFKYQPNNEDENIRDANIPVVRLAETYLIAAEAAAKLGNNADAVAYLNPIVQRANPNNSVEGEVITVDRVKKERRKELVAEGHRMFDAIRDGGQIIRHDEDTHKHTTKTKHFAMEDEPYDWNFYKIVLPIPTREMKANQNMEQNPSYGD